MLFQPFLGHTQGCCCETVLLVAPVPGHVAPSRLDALSSDEGKVIESPIVAIAISHINGTTSTLQDETGR